MGQPWVGGEFEAEVERAQVGRASSDSDGRVKNPGQLPPPATSTSLPTPSPGHLSSQDDSASILTAPGPVSSQEPCLLPLSQPSLLTQPGASCSGFQASGPPSLCPTQGLCTCSPFWVTGSPPQRTWVTPYLPSGPAQPMLPLRSPPWPLATSIMGLLLIPRYRDLHSKNEMSC